MKKWNPIQRKILTIAVIIFVLINLFPPWMAYLEPPEYTVSKAVGYSLIISPPQSPHGYESYVVINYGRLFLEWAILATLLLVLLRITKTRVS